MLTRQQITAIAINSMTQAMQVCSDMTAKDDAKVNHLCEIIRKFADDLDHALEDAEKTAAL